MTTLPPCKKKQAAIAGLKAAKVLLINHIIFASACEQPAVRQHLETMLSENVGWHLVNNDPQRVMEPSASARLQEITAPTLVILGERDMADFHAITAILAPKINQAQLVTFPGVGHMSNMEAPTLFNATVLAFLRKHTE